MQQIFHRWRRQNMRKAFSMSFIAQMLIALGCLYGTQFLVGVASAARPPALASPARAAHVPSLSSPRIHRAHLTARFRAKQVNCGAPPISTGPYGQLGSSEADSSDTPAAKSFDHCMAKWNIIYMLYIPFTVGFLLYAGYRRNQMRAKYAIPGDEYEDYFYWLCCGPCVLCQETRTLSYHNVEDGNWPEPGERQPILPKQA